MNLDRNLEKARFPKYKIVYKHAVGVDMNVKYPPTVTV
jgi:hypothetical protein